MEKLDVYKIVSNKESEKYVDIPTEFFRDQNFLAVLVQKHNEILGMVYPEYLGDNEYKKILIDLDPMVIKYNRAFYENKEIAEYGIRKYLENGGHGFILRAVQENFNFDKDKFGALVIPIEKEVQAKENRISDIMSLEDELRMEIENENRPVEPYSTEGGPSAFDLAKELLGRYKK